MNTTDFNSPLSLSEKSLLHLNKARKWAKFLSIYGFISCGFVILSGLAMFVMQFFIPQHTEVMKFPFFIIGILYLLLGTVSFFPAFYLYKFSENGSKLINYRNQNNVDGTFDYLGRFFKFVGILVIVLLASYLLLIPLFIVFHGIF